MNKENYELFGLDENASDEELEARYRELKAKYNEEKWQDGEAGTNAARMLGKLDAAYEEIMDERRSKKKSAEEPSAAYEEAAAAIRSGDLNRAQQLLDGFNERNAEWHYLQSVVFYKKNWMNESKKQLEIAMQMDPSNQKYRTAYDKLNARASYKGQTGGAPNTDPNPDPGPADPQMGGNGCMTLWNTCACLSWLWCCCDCCR